MKGLRPRDVQGAEHSGEDSAGDEAEPAPAHAAAASAAAASGIIRDADGAAAGEAEPAASAGDSVPAIKDARDARADHDLAA